MKQTLRVSDQTLVTQLLGYIKDQSHSQPSAAQLELTIDKLPSVFHHDRETPAK